MEEKPLGRAKGRGRARGRARGTSADAASAQPKQPGASAPQAQRAQYRGAERPGALQPKQMDTLQQGMGQMKISGGNAGNGGNGSSGNGNGNGDGAAASSGRGVTRGRRDISNMPLTQTRPADLATKQGAQGKVCDLVANYFPISKQKGWKLCLYHVTFNPDEERTRTRKNMLRQHTEKLQNDYIFDGMQLYLRGQLANPVTEFMGKHPDSGETYQVKIQFIKEIAELSTVFIHVMNIILNRCQDHLGLKFMGRNFYNPAQERTETKYNIKVWPGYSTSIRQFEHQLLLNVDLCHKFIRTDTAYHLLRQMGANAKRDSDKLLGLVVMTSYNEKTYRIDDIDFSMRPRSTFPTRVKEGNNIVEKQITYMDYYENRYNIKIRDVNQPMLLSKPKLRDRRRGQTENIYLVPELCVVTGIADEMRNDYTVMKELAQYLRTEPPKRVETLRGFNKSLATNPKVQKELKSWGLELSPDLIRLQGRILPDEFIVQNGIKIGYNREKSDWSMETRSTPMNSSVKLASWVLIHPASCSDGAYGMWENLKFVSRPMGFMMNQPKFINLGNDSRTGSYIEAIRSCQGVQMIMVILQSNKADTYSAVKKFISTQMGIPSQCVVSRTLNNQKRLRSVATKVAIQMNVKLGGEVWNVEAPLSNTMIIGYDTYHDSVKKGSSYGAVVSSYNSVWTRYYGQVSEHVNRTELSDNFGTSVTKALRHYIEVNQNVAPKYIIVYRDGVGEGQLDYVKETEVETIKNACKTVLGYAPKLAFIVVSKRINTRIMRDERGYMKNPTPGTVVDDNITLPERYDFFLVSQSVNQGTVSPTSFNIIDDSTGLKPDHFQRLSYKLTHLYYNWQGTVRVPAPCLYAHKLAFITGQSIHQSPNPALEDKLWFL